VKSPREKSRGLFTLGFGNSDRIFTGLFIGLSQQDTLRILRPTTMSDESSKDHVVVEKEKGDRQWFMVHFKNGKLSEMHVIAPFGSIEGSRNRYLVAFASVGILGKNAS